MEVHTANIAFKMVELRSVLVDHVESARGRVDRYIDPELTELFEWVEGGQRVVEELQAMVDFAAEEEEEEVEEEKEENPHLKRQRGGG